MSNLNRPESEIDLFCDDALSDPYPRYRKLRDLAPAVWLKSMGMFALPRFDDVRNAIDREKQLKRWRREKKVKLIEELNPSWRDLSEEWC